MPPLCEGGGVRIAMVSDAFLPRLGGIEVQVSDLSRRLVNAGHEVEVFTLTHECRKPPPAGRTPPTDWPFAVHRYPTPTRLPRDLLVNPAARRRFARALRGGRFDVAHVHLGVLAPFAVDAVQVSIREGVPVVVTWHSLVPASVAATLRATGALDRWAAKGIVLSAVSEAAGRRIEAAMRSPRPLVVLSNGIDVGRWWAGSPANHVPESPVDRFGLRVIGAMRLARLKRPLALLRIVERARTLAPEVPIMADLIGDGPLRGKAERWVAERRAHWAHLPGRLGREALRAAYAEADVYLAPAVREAFGIAALEARCAGLPVVGVRGSGVEEFVTDGVNGLLMDGDEAMARAIADLARNPPQLARMRAHNVETEPSRFDWPQVVDSAVSLYGQAVFLTSASRG